MPNTPRMRWAYPRQNQNPWYGPFVDFTGGVDASVYALTEDRNALAAGGGTFTYVASSGQVTWDATIEVLAAFSGFLWQVPAGSVFLQEGQVFFVELPRAPSDNVDLAPQVASNLSAVTSIDSAYVLAFRRLGKVYFRNGRSMADGDAFEVFETTGSGGGGGGGGSGTGSTALIFKPGSGASGPVVYASWSALMAQLTAMRDAGNHNGVFSILFDNSSSSITIPAGTYDMTNVEWRGLDTVTATPIAVAQGAILTKFRRASGVGITFGGSTSPVQDVAAGDRVFFKENASLTCSGSTGFFNLTSLGASSAAFVLDRSIFTNAGTRCVTNAGSGVVFVVVAGAQLGSNTITGTGTVSALVDAISTASETHVSLTGFTFVPFPVFRAPTRLTSSNLTAIVGENDIDTTSGNKIVTLPAALNNRGSIILVKHVGTANTITVNPTGSDTIDGAASYTISTVRGSAIFVSNGGSPGDWRIVSERGAGGGGSSPTPGQKISQSIAMATAQVTELSSFVAVGNFALNPNDYALAGTTVTVKFLTVGSISDSTTTGQIQLFNLTDSVIVTTTSYTGSGDTTPTKKISSALSLPSSEKMYEIRIRVTGGSPPDKVFAQWAGFQVDNTY